jgi:ABC-type multidrug transport system fused ATPase/permease subunit
MHFFDLLKQVGAPARVGLVAPIDVVVPPGNTGLDPSQTSFFQVCHLNLMMIMFVLIAFGVFFLQHSSVACLVLAVFLLTLIATLFFSTGAQYSNQD